MIHSRRSRRIREIRERGIEALLLGAASLSVLVTVGIVFTLISESIPFFEHVSLQNFFTDTLWTPLFADPHFGILPLVSGTLVTTVVALLIAVPAGLVTAIYLSEYCPAKFRDLLKPMLELLSAVPTVVYGYFALLFVTPLLQRVFPDLPGFNMLSAGVVMGVMIVPYISSLCEDAMRAVPMYLREASFAVGATRLQTALGVVVPSAFSGITASIVLALSRAVGETMIVSIAAGMQPQIAWNPMESAQTLTAFIVAVSLGDVAHGTVGFQSIFVAGLTLFLMTFGFNIVGHKLRKRFREVY